MTVKQKQCLLYYLGYYIGNIDGKWGQLSQTATKAFQADYGLEADGICGEITQKAMKHAVTYGMPIIVTKEPSWDDIKYFERREFRCKCGRCNGYPVEPSWDLLLILDDIREHFKAPVRINSGIRCEAHNKSVGGASKSQHLYGTAADIKVDGVPPSEVAEYAETLLPNTGGIGRYGTFTHVDTRKTKSRWNG
jgi:hypothetical protein